MKRPVGRFGAAEVSRSLVRKSLVLRTYTHAVNGANELLVLGRDELVSLEVSWADLVGVLEDAFRQKAEGLVQNPPKPALHQARLLGGCGPRRSQVDRGL